jgi:hypothetical protein
LKHRNAQGGSVPKRVVDGEALWLSNKLRQVPEQFRAEYANLLPLALANGTFECDARKIWARVYIYNRPGVTLQDVEAILESFERAKMLFRWRTEDGAIWGYWIGIDKPGRLPSGTDWKHAAKGATVPPESLQSFLLAANNPQLVSDQPVTGHGPVDDRSGLGLGLGLGKDFRANPSGSHEFVLSEPTPKPPDEKLLAVQRVWDYYIEKFGKNPKLLTFTTVRKQKGMARLGECLVKTAGNLANAEGLMRCAVDALAVSPWHIGENPGRKKYLSWEDNLFPDIEQLEKWLERT